jgi:hypothetical protein
MIDCEAGAVISRPSMVRRTNGSLTTVLPNADLPYSLRRAAAGVYCDRL